MKTTLKNALLGLIFLAALPSEAAVTRILLDYRFGNQVTQSELVVLSNGLIVRRERSQGKYRYLADGHVHPSQLSTLTNRIDSAARETTSYVEGSPTSFGSKSGSLLGYTSDGALTVLFGEKRAERAGDNDQLSYQPGTEAREVRRFIQAIVTDKMPLDKIGE